MLSILRLGLLLFICSPSLAYYTNFNTDCKRPGAGDIIFASPEQPDVLMVLSTIHKISYPRQLRDRLERDGFLVYPVPDREIENTWCNTEKIMSISKAAVYRAKVRLIDNQDGTDGRPAWPYRATLRKVQRLLEDEYPSTEIGLAAGLPFLFLALAIMNTLRLNHMQQKKEQADLEAGSAGTSSADAGTETSPTVKAEKGDTSHAANRPPSYE